MRRVLLTLMTGMWLAPIPLMVGCDRTVSEDKTVDQKSNGTTVTKENKVTENPNTGEVTKTSEKSVQQ
ncbi:MAG TPA: hypothetical protein VKK61_04200 [Tepidisphaeraceae bacterium]|nr:hypothetical protein [Tepidisphaeraceae bacterium]